MAIRYVFLHPKLTRDGLVGILEWKAIMFNMKKRLLKNPETESVPQEQEEFERIQIATCIILLEVAKSDDEFLSIEKTTLTAILKKKFQLSAEAAEELMGIASKKRDESIDLCEFTNLINKNYTKEQKKKIVEAVWKIIYADEKENHAGRHDGCEREVAPTHPLTQQPGSEQQQIERGGALQKDRVRRGGQFVRGDKRDHRRRVGQADEQNARPPKTAPAAHGEKESQTGDPGAQAGHLPARKRDRLDDRAPGRKHQGGGEYLRPTEDR